MLRKKLICSISGGVDSAVTALLLKRKGIDVCGVYMRNWDIRDEQGFCQADKDQQYARRVCDVLDIPLTEVNFVKEYWNNVFQPMIEQYEIGNTVNPDIWCNSFIKFDALHKKCEEIFETKDFVVATGHYAGTSVGDRVLYEEEISDVKLIKAVDTRKDQTFFLHRITEEALKRSLFPLQSYMKTQVKKIAEDSEINFTLEKKESYGICFVGKRKFGEFISDYITPRKGDFVDLESGKILGSHAGMFQFTRGQRSRISGLDQSYLVLHRDHKSGNVVVVPYNHKALYNKSLLISEPHWIASSDSCLRHRVPFRCQMRYYHGGDLIDCTLIKLNSDLLLISDLPLRALTVGQDAIFYSEDRCLGGGKIRSLGPSLHELREPEVNFDGYRDQQEIALWRQLVAEFPHHFRSSMNDDVISRATHR